MRTDNFFYGFAVLIILSSSVNADCLNNRLFTYSGTGANDYTLVDLGTVSAYADPKLTKVNVTSGQSYWYYDDHRLLIQTTAGNEDYTINIYDDTFEETKESSATAPVLVTVLGLSDFTQDANAYTISFWDEETNSVWDYDTDSVTTLDVLCDTYTPATIDLLDYEENPIILGTREDPRFILQMEDGVTREQNIVADLSAFRYYLPANKTGLIIVDYQLQDYVGDYADSILHIQRSREDTYYDIDSREWDSVGDVKKVWLKPEVYYKISVTTDTSTQDKGLFKYSINGSQAVRILEPTIYYDTDSYDGLRFLTWHNVSTKRAYCYYNVDDDLTLESISFSVYNASRIPNELLYYYHTHNLGKEGTISYLIPNENHTYKVECSIEYQHGSPLRVNLYTFFDSDRFLNPPFSDEVMGYSISEIFKGFSLFLIVFIFGLASMSNASLLGLLGVSVVWLFNYWKWIEINTVIISFLLVLAVAYRLKASRRGVG